MSKKIVIVKKRAVENGGKKRSCLGTLVALAALLVSGFYLLNPTAGVDVLPDSLPLVGNLDEAFFTVVFLSALAYFGLEVPFLSRKYGLGAPSRAALESRNVRENAAAPAPKDGNSDTGAKPSE